MGTDVHAVAQAKVGDGWRDVPMAWDQDRHYFLFAWLAGVRNGFGFAGCPTHTPIAPLAEPRGYPPDFEVDDDNHPTTLEAYCPRRRGWLDDAEKGAPKFYMGDHTYSWLTADEILQGKRPDRVWQTGIVPRAFFDAWDGHTPPNEWSGGISGGGVKVAESPTDVEPESTHVRIWWIRPDDELAYFVDEVKRLKDEHGEVRLVFGFDS